MDEPFGALDAQTRAQMQEWLLGIWSGSGKTVLFVTHDVDEAIFLADRIVVLTARPAQIKSIIPVSLARPRAYDVMTTEPYVAIKREVLGLIREETARAAEHYGTAPTTSVHHRIPK
jgi:ABC-type nitrate/sulfonate/bicarbonate transport system ATPase subunit